MGFLLGVVPRRTGAGGAQLSDIVGLAEVLQSQGAQWHLELLAGL